jgi:hypothetical protein
LSVLEQPKDKVLKDFKALGNQVNKDGWHIQPLVMKFDGHVDVQPAITFKKDDLKVIVSKDKQNKPVIWAEKSWWF